MLEPPTRKPEKCRQTWLLIGSLRMWHVRAHAGQCLKAHVTCARTCRIQYEELLRGEARPYLMGERQRPDCVNCDRDELWSHFCQYKSHGPKCPPHDQDLLFNTLMDRCAWALPANSQLRHQRDATPCFTVHLKDNQMMSMMSKALGVNLCTCLCPRAKVGAAGAKDLLELTPCDLFPYVRGRTLWLVGDSMMQVRSLQTEVPVLVWPLDPAFFEWHVS